MTVKGNHPLAEIIARKLFGIESVPTAEQRKMVNRAVKASVEYYEAEIERKDEALKEAYEILSHAKVFVTTRQKIKKPEGEYWYDHALTTIEQALSTKEDSDE